MFLHKSMTEQRNHELREIKENDEEDGDRNEEQSHNGSVDTKMASMAARTENIDKLNMLEKFFDGPWNDWVRTHRWAIFILGITLSVYAGVRSREIRGLSQMERYFP